jgi:hypothetical protein
MVTRRAFAPKRAEATASCRQASFKGLEKMKGKGAHHAGISCTAIPPPRNLADERVDDEPPHRGGNPSRYTHEYSGMAFRPARDVKGARLPSPPACPRVDVIKDTGVGFMAARSVKGACGAG